MQNPYQIDPPTGLMGRVFARLVSERQLLHLRKYLGWVVLGFILGLLASIPAWYSLLSELARSGFARYLSLIFTDFRLVVAHWQDYSMSLLESLPAFNLISLLALTLLFVSTIKFTRIYLRAWRRNRALIPKH